jgi:hypothetical protein
VYCTLHKKVQTIKLLLSGNSRNYFDLYPISPLTSSELQTAEYLMDLIFFSLLRRIWKKCLIDLTPEVTGKVEKVHAGCLDTIFIDLNLKRKTPAIPKYQQ